MLLLVEQIFWPAEISFRNRLFFCVATVTLSSGNKLLMQNLIRANKLNFWLVITIPSNFFRSDITATESNFSVKRKHIFQWILYFVSWKLILCLVKTVCFCSKPFFAIGNHYWNNRKAILKEKHFPNRKDLLWFSCQKKQFFRTVLTYFSMNASFLVVKMDFLASTCHFLYIFSRVRPVKVFFPSSGNEYLLNESFIQAVEKNFLSSGNSLLYLRVFFY